MLREVMIVKECKEGRAAKVEALRRYFYGKGIVVFESAVDEAFERVSGLGNKSIVIIAEPGTTEIKKEEKETLRLVRKIRAESPLKGVIFLCGDAQECHKAESLGARIFHPPMHTETLAEECIKFLNA